jgi:hypothetical protein
MLTFEDFDMSPSADQLVLVYDNGFKGVIKDTSANEILYATAPGFHETFPEAVGAGKGRLSAPYKACLTLDPDYGRCESQTTGDCVSHNTRNAGMVDYCVDALFGETTFKGRFATENIYGYRGHAGQGASCSRLANYVGPDGPGGFLPRAVYGDGSNSVDLSRYSSGIGARWGWSGTPDWLNKIAAENKAQRVFKCQSIEEARDAIASGFGLSRCGWWGYSRKRDANGVSDVSGRWAHAMAVHGADDTDSAKKIDPNGIFCVQNSWGLWNSGPKRADQPDGSFWVKAARLAREIDQGGVFVIASVRGFNRVAVADLISKVAELSAA